MKKNTFLVLILGLIYVSCTKEASPKPGPSAYLRFGYRTGGIMSSGMSTVIKIEEYSNQDFIYLVQVNQDLAIQIREENVPHEQLSVKQSMDLSFVLPVHTNLDSEVFISRRNVHVQGAMMGSDPETGTYSIGQDFVIPVQITFQAIPHNNILEIAPEGDVINCSYHSDYTGTSVTQSLKINKQ